MHVAKLKNALSGSITMNTSTEPGTEKGFRHPARMRTLYCTVYCVHRWLPLLITVFTGDFRFWSLCQNEKVLSLCNNGNLLRLKESTFMRGLEKKKKILIWTSENRGMLWLTLDKKTPLLPLETNVEAFWAESITRGNLPCLCFWITSVWEENTTSVINSFRTIWDSW